MKYLFLIITLLFASVLMADIEDRRASRQEYLDIKQQQILQEQQKKESVTELDNHKKQSSIVVGFGKAINEFQGADKFSQGSQWNSYSRYKNLDSKTSLNVTYLRKVVDFMYIGADLGVLTSNQTNENIRFVNDGIITVIANQSTFYQIYTTMLILDLNLLSIGNFDLNTQMGGGLAFHYLKFNQNLESLVGYIRTQNEAIAIGFAGKSGLIGTYNFNDNLALGIGAYYIFNQEAEFKELKTIDGDSELNSDYRIKNNGTTVINLQLKYSF